MGLMIQGALLGLGANLLFDLWQRRLALATGQPAPNWAPIGRWFWHLREGRVFHDDIGLAAPYQHELRLGLAVHPHTHPLVISFDHHALVAHAPHQVERFHRFAAQGQLLADPGVAEQAGEHDVDAQPVVW